MKHTFMIHKSLGICNKIIEFTGEKNQLILVSAPMKTKYVKKGKTYVAVPTKFGHQDKFWILWGPIGLDESELGKICLLFENGRTWPHHKAIKEFMKIAETVDMLTMSKLY
jgi:hypothetical protein